MPINFTEISTNGLCTPALDSVLTSAMDASASDGGSSGGTETVTLASGPSTRNQAGLISVAVAAGVVWGAGQWTVRLNVTTANMNMTLDTVIIVRTSSGCVGQEVIGTAASLAISLGSTGVKSVNVTGISVTPSVGDIVTVESTVSNSSMNSQSVVFTMDQNIDSPFTVATQSLLWDPLRPMRPHLVRKVREWLSDLMALPPRISTAFRRALRNEQRYKEAA